MPTFNCEVYIQPRKDILDPQGDAVNNALGNLDFKGVSQVKPGRFLTLRLDAPDEGAAKGQLDEMCKKLLANPITENYQLKVTAQ